MTDEEAVEYLGKKSAEELDRDMYEVVGGFLQMKPSVEQSSKLRMILRMQNPTNTSYAYDLHIAFLRQDTPPKPIPLLVLIATIRRGWCSSLGDGFNFAVPGGEIHVKPSLEVVAVVASEYGTSNTHKICLFIFIS